MFLDRLQGSATLVRNAVRLRETIERLGPSAIKIGQQLSIRTDLIPQEFSDELIALLDNVPPFTLEVAHQLVKQELSQPVEVLFSEFSEEPIGSASIACVYKARLHTGEVVAVKIRRPEVTQILVSDLAVISILCRFAEFTGIIERGKSEPVVQELRRMLLDELNFLVEARQTELFREDAAKTNRYVTAPKVFRHFSTSGVLVTEFIEGVFLLQVLDGIQRGDEAYLKSLSTQGYNLQMISRRLMNVFYWQLFENPFFHADPHPSNVVVKPDGKIVLIDFGATGTLTSKYRRDLLLFVQSLAEGSIEGMVRYMIASLEPLPPLNLEAYTNEMYHAMREYLFTARSKHSNWQERSSGRAMTALTEVSRKYNIVMRADVLRYIRASFQFDSIVYRLNPDLDSRKEFRRYLRQRTKRIRKEMRKSRKQISSIGSNTASLQLLNGKWQERLSNLDSTLSFLSNHTVQLEWLFRRRVSGLMLLLAWIVSIVRTIAAAVLVLVLWTWCRQYHPLWPISRFIDAGFTFCFSSDLQMLVAHIPTLSERLWFWVSLALVVLLFSLQSLMENLQTPKSKVE